MKVLITGGAGYIGYSLVKRLVSYSNQLHSITIYDNLSRKNFSFFTEAKFDNKPINFIQGDILDGRTLLKAVEEHDCIIHLAAHVTTPHADSQAHTFDQVNHWGTAQLAQTIEQAKPEKVIYLSSVSVYGSSSDPVTEEFPTSPISFYGKSKLDGEKQIERLQDYTHVYVLRSANVYGYNPSYRTDAVINRFMFEANFNKRISINGSGDQYRSFIHVDKVAYSIHCAIENQLDPGTYNVVEHNLTINDVAQEVKTIYPELDIIHVNYTLKMRDIKTAIPCKLFETISIPNKSLQEELMDFKNQFSF